MSDIICIGWITLDFIAHVPELPVIAAEIVATDFDAACGGRAASQAMAVSAVDGSVGLIARVGADQHSRLLTEELEELGIAHDTVDVAPAATGMRVVSRTPDNRQVSVVYPGANDYLTVDDLNRRAALFLDAKVVSVTTEVAPAVAFRALELARNNGAHGILTHTAGAQVSDKVLSAADVVVVSSSHSRGLLDSGLAGRQTEHAARALCQRGVPAVILLTPDKAVLATAESAQMMPSPNPLDSEDAVDAFLGGLLSGLASGESIDKALIRGVRIACLLVD